MLISAAASAQKLTVEAPNGVAMDETFRIIFTAEGNMSDFDWPGSEDFQIVWGPQKGSMSSTTIVNGKRESVHQESCTYILQPTKEGKFTTVRMNIFAGAAESGFPEFGSCSYRYSLESGYLYASYSEQYKCDER